METDHERQREQLASQKSLQDARLAYDKLLSEKHELEYRLNSVEDRKNTAQQKSDELHYRLQSLEENKTSSIIKLHDLEVLQVQLEHQFVASQQKEKELTQVISFWFTYVISVS